AADHVGSRVLEPLVDRLEPIVDRSLPAGPFHGADGLSPGRGHQPATDAGRVLQPMEMLGQPEPCRLADVGGIHVIEPERPGHRPDHAGEPIHQPVPRIAVAPGGRLHEAGRILDSHEEKCIGMYQGGDMSLSFGARIHRPEESIMQPKSKQVWRAAAAALTLAACWLAAGAPVYLPW
ncbi:MAG: hypothetical protein QOG64_1621, partial [Acidimicrobiaceae bacterium]|nr:hypothetical protein [Acidimicrobiaceae bacterium]